eukprot:CAMPEP_0175697590 /NCGR_PEP_ID=MMETSP0097-20121207/33535_1 /TAXON_ID=311494 /ORGANISM="Alexandrium monilatum, Strain CCMP3105" /LENGTH=61 /DNA_ID=CAMNT_0017004763 /DNA_START=131 /DNA_END=313 /DNA_ORIENTATION=+
MTLCRADLPSPAHRAAEHGNAGSKRVELVLNGAFPPTSSRLLPSRRALALGPVRAGGGAAP